MQRGDDRSFRHSLATPWRLPDASSSTPGDSSATPDDSSATPRDSKEPWGTADDTAFEDNKERAQAGSADPALGEPEPKVPDASTFDHQDHSYSIAICLLKRISVTLHAGEWTQEVPLPPTTSKRLLLLAYLASRQGVPVYREKILEDVFGHGKSDEEASPQQLGEAFDSHKKLIRADIREAITHFNTTCFLTIDPSHVELFTYQNRQYRLASHCHVDLDILEQQHQIIEHAKKQGILNEHIPETINQACEVLIGAYTGDFLAEVIATLPDEFDPWVSSWVRKPFTRYRDYYLQALWYAATYHAQQAHLTASPQADGPAQSARMHWGQAADLYLSYAMHACNSRFDLKVSFSPNGQHGERVMMSERALRRAIVALGVLGDTSRVDQAYATYKKHMRRISAKSWMPSLTTEADVQAAKNQTKVYRYPLQAEDDAQHDSLEATPLP